jgi:hypothetical protein
LPKKAACCCSCLLPASAMGSAPAASSHDNACALQTPAALLWLLNWSLQELERVQCCGLWIALDASSTSGP